MNERVKELELNRELGTIDQDQDGVLDAVDQDVNSAPNALVTTRGTYSDVDRDLVPDYKDQEPLTPIGNEVDENGVSINPSSAASLSGAPCPSIYFAEGSTHLGQMELFKLADVARFMLNNDKVQIVISGHASKNGSEEYNRQLSEERANAVKSCLVNDFFLDESRISVEALGETAALSTFPAINRRVDVSFK